MTRERVDVIKTRLHSALKPQSLDVVDDSALHAGHAGAQSGKGHFTVTIVCEQFTGLAPLQRHRMIYRALGETMETDIHALSIQAYAPDEL